MPLDRTTTPARCPVVHTAAAAALAAATLAAALAAGCTDAATPLDVTLHDVTLATFVSGVDHPYFPLPVGARWTYEAQTEDGVERIEVEVLAETRVVNGVAAVVVRDTAYLDDVAIEDTKDWYAQDSVGNVWYLGEDTCELAGGVCVSHAGAWEWGVDGALPGIVMPAQPRVDGVAYYQEFYPGEAEDVGQVVAVGVAVSVPAGSYTDCITTKDSSTLDRSLLEHKTYCRGVGNVHVAEDDVAVELVRATGL